MNIIVVGCGKIGSALTKQLCQEGHNVSIIDQNRSLVETVANEYDVLGVAGNGASYQVQVNAGLETADLLIAATGMDELNLLCCLIARKMGHCHTVSRVKNPVYSKEIEVLRKELGLSMLFNPELAAAAEIGRILNFPSAIKIETFAKGRVEILKYKIEKGNLLHNYRLMDISHKLKCEVLVCAVERGDQVEIPNGNFILQEGDVVSIVATPRRAHELFKKIGIETNRVRSCMMVGGGGITYYVARILLAAGVSVTIIEKNPSRCEFLSEELPGAMVICGDGIDQNLLYEEGVDQVEAFCALTNLDEENILLSLFAKRRTKAKLITKVHKVTFDDIIQELDLGSIICPKYVVAEHIIRYVRAMQNSIGSNIETLYKIIEDRVEALEFIVKGGSPVIGIPLEKMQLKPNILVACINHKGNVTIPKGQDIIREGDSVVIVTTASGLNDITDILKN